MSRIAFALLTLLLLSADVQSVENNGDAAITFEIASGKDKGKPFVEYRFLNGECVFWEYFRSHVYQGHLSNSNDHYRISSLVFSFEYPKPYASHKQFQGEDSLSKCRGVTHISIGSERLKVHKFLVLEGSGKQTIYLSDSYLMPIGYDTRKVKVRVTEKGLNNLRMTKCNTSN